MCGTVRAGRVRHVTLVAVAEGMGTVANMTSSRLLAVSGKMASGKDAVAEAALAAAGFTEIRRLKIADAIRTTLDEYPVECPINAAQGKPPTSAEMRVFRSSPQLMDPAIRARCEAFSASGQSASNHLNVIEMETHNGFAIGMD